MYKVIKRFLNVFLVVLALFTVFMVNGTVESILVNKYIDEFKSRSVFVVEIGNTKYFVVQKIHDYEDTSRHIKNHPQDLLIGAKADIYVTSRNPIAASTIMGWISQRTWVGHSGLIIDDRGRQTIEITGNISPEENVVQIWRNDWISDDPGSPQIMLLRIKDTTEEQRDQIVDYAMNKLGYRYNYSFLFNRVSTYYCSDLVSRSVASVGININYDFLATTGADMIVSKHTYIVYYREKAYIDGQEKYEVYYLVDE